MLFLQRDMFEQRLNRIDDSFKPCPPFFTRGMIYFLEAGDYCLYAEPGQDFFIHVISYMRTYAIKLWPPPPSAPFLWYIEKIQSWKI